MSTQKQVPQKTESEIRLAARAAPKRRDYSRWRAATLASVYVLMAIHVTHWMVKGKTVAPLELNEVMYTLELGIVTVGFLFMCAACLFTMIFGRFFCSWGCHILALQDLSTWILSKLHIRPKAVRSRAMVWIPVAAAIYMFAWPQITRIWAGRPAPELHKRTDAEGWASFTTENFWRNLPGPGVIAITFGTCGFLIVYVLGSRGFCTYGCPYGTVFRLADRFAPGRIRLKRLAECLQCGTCTAACTSHVRVHEELNRYGMVVNPACLKDLDCVAACPQNNVHFGFGRPGLLKTVVHDTTVRKQYDFALWEELLMVLVFLAVLVVFRGLYDLFPFLMTIALGTIVAYLLVLAVRMMRLPAVQWNRWQLKSNGRLTPAGRGFAGGILAFAAFTAHSAAVHYRSFEGRRLAQAVQEDGDINLEVAHRALEHLQFADTWGLISTAQDRAQLSSVHYHLAGKQYGQQRASESRHHLEHALRYDPNSAMAHYDLGALLIEHGELSLGLEHLKRTVMLKPEFADGHYNLGVGLAMNGQLIEAEKSIQRALALRPDDPQTNQFAAYLNQLLMAR